MDTSKDSIFQNYYAEVPFVDRYAEDANGAVDVIVPVMHTNELWRANLLSFYREIPIRTLLIGDGGCIDNSLEIVKGFPRVKILDHRGFTSLGYSLRKMIESVQTEWFVYLHSDVYLPPNWFEEMRRRQAEYDWFECRQRITALVEYEIENPGRALSGAQMGRTKALQEAVTKVDDDFLYRNEDLILASLVKEKGYVYGVAENTFHFHQAMYKQSTWVRKIKSIKFELELGREEEVRACLTMAKGIVKYLDPPLFVSSVVANVNRLQEMGELRWAEFDQWVQATNPAWLPHIRKYLRQRGSFRARWRSFLSAALHLVRG